MRSVCIVTNEIYPLDRGGIARLAYNFALNNIDRPDGVDLHFLLPAKFREHAAKIEAAFGEIAAIHYCPDNLEGIAPLGSLIQSFGARDSYDYHMIESLHYYAGLVQANREMGVDFDIVEFPDFGGWGATSIAAKQAGLAFNETLFAVRLHSAFSLIVDYEPFTHEASDWMAARCDLERQGVRDADLVIGHLPSIARLNQERFALAPEWLDKVHIEMPPITLSDSEIEVLEQLRDEGTELPPARDFLFTARLQPFKRPDIFIRAAVWFLDEYPDADNSFLISSYGWDHEYIDWLKRLVPMRWEGRVRFLEGLSGAERTALMLQSILVIPSDFESLCLLAFEGRLLGMKVILNRQCLAFGSEPEVWREGEDALFFEGDFVSLAKTMRESLDWTPAPMQALPQSTPYWELPTEQLLPAGLALRTQVRLACVMYGATSLGELSRQVQDVLAHRTSQFNKIHVLIPRELFQAAALPLAAWQSPKVTLHPISWTEPTGAEIMALVEQLPEEAVAFLPADMRVESSFWVQAARALGGDASAGAFTSHTVVRNDSNPVGYVLNYGDAPTVALLTNRIAHRASVFRRETLLELGIRDQAEERWHEDLSIRLVSAGYRVLVAPAALATQPERRRQSRIQSGRFFASHRDGAGRLLGAPYRQASAGTNVNDSVEVIGHDRWVNQQNEVRRRIAKETLLEPDGLRFNQVELRGASASEDGRYFALEIVVNGLDIGRSSLDWLSFKLAQYDEVPEIEFREGGNAAQFFRNWSTAGADQWGKLAVLRASDDPHPFGAFFDHLGHQDLVRFRALLENLDAVVNALELSADESRLWNAAAAALRQYHKLNK